MQRLAAAVAWHAAAHHLLPGLPLSQPHCLPERWQPVPPPDCPLASLARPSLQPRLIAYQADGPHLSYTYSGATLAPAPWHPAIAALKARVEAVAGATFNCWCALHRPCVACCCRLQGSALPAHAVVAFSAQAPLLRPRLCFEPRCRTGPPPPRPPRPPSPIPPSLPPSCCSLLNLYRSGADAIAWHSDNERLFGRAPTIGRCSAWGCNQPGGRKGGSRDGSRWRPGACTASACLDACVPFVRAVERAAGG